MAMQQADPQLVAKAADFIRRREKSKAELVEELTLLQERVSRLEQSQAASDSDPPSDPTIFESEEGPTSLDIGGSASLEETIDRLKERNRELEQSTEELKEKLESALEAADRRDSLEQEHSDEAAEWRRRSDGLQEENLRIEKELVELQVAHEELAEAQRRLKRQVDASPGLLWTLAPDLQGVDFNQTFFDLVGKSPDEDPEEWQAHVHPEDWDSFNETVRRAAGKQEPFSLEHRVMCGDGSYRWFWSVGTPCLDEASPASAGEAGPSYAGVSLDVSGQRDAAQRFAEEEGLRKDQLRQCWLSRETELLDLHDELQEIIAAPLAAASGQLEQLEERLAELRELWGIAEQARKRLGTGQSPAVLQREGLEGAVPQLTRHFGLCLGVEAQHETVGPIPRLSPETELLIYAALRNLLEGLSCSGESAGLLVALGCDEGQLRIAVQGREMHLENEDSIESMGRLMEPLSGQVRIEATSEEGFEIELIVPASF